MESKPSLEWLLFYNEVIPALSKASDIKVFQFLFDHRDSNGNVVLTSYFKSTIEKELSLHKNSIYLSIQRMQKIGILDSYYGGAFLKKEFSRVEKLEEDVCNR